MGLRVLIVEDELLIAETVRLYLEERNHIVTDICVSYEEAVASYQSDRPDVALVDIRLYGQRSGIDFARFLDQEPEKTPYIYVTSQYDALTFSQALNTLPKGYLVKPLQKETLWTTVEVAYNTNKFLSRGPIEFAVSDGAKTHHLLDQDVTYVQSEHVYARIFLRSGSDVFARLSLSRFVEQVASPLFFRCHRSYIINLSQIEVWQRDSVILQEGIKIPVSRSRRSALKGLLG